MLLRQGLVKRFFQSEEIEQVITPDVYCCNHCKKEIEEGRGLRPVVFKNGDNDTEKPDYCSWKCFIESLSNLKTEDISFISLPNLTFDKNREKSTSGLGFIQEVERRYKSNAF